MARSGRSQHNHRWACVGAEVGGFKKFVYGLEDWKASAPIGGSHQHPYRSASVGVRFRTGLAVIYRLEEVRDGALGSWYYHVFMRLIRKPEMRENR